MNETLENFVTYLRNKGYRLNTYNGRKNTLNRYLIWLKAEEIKPEQVTYNNLLGYIQKLQAQNLHKRTINDTLTTIRHYYNMLQSNNQVTSNPAETLQIKNTIKNVPHNLLKWEELETIYKTFESSGVTGKRNKAMLGLMIYQGIHTGELTAIEVNDVKLEDGNVYIPQTGRSNSRTLSLESFQILQLQKYITTIRPVILALSEKTSDKLFISTGTGNGLNNSFARLLKQIRKQNPSVKDFKQIRASIITLWLKKHNIRQVQYMTGHRYISSTEHYRTDTLETLQELIEELHPLNNID